VINPSKEKYDEHLISDQLNVFFFINTL